MGCCEDGGVMGCCEDGSGMGVVKMAVLWVL